MRYESLFSSLQKEKLDALLISSSYNIAYLTGFQGFSKTEREGYMLVTKRKAFIFSSGLNSAAVSNYIHSLPHITLVEFSPRSPLTKNILAKIIKEEKIKILGFEKHHFTFAEYERLQKDLKVKLSPTENIVEKMREIKEKEEIANIEKACKLTDKTFTFILTKIKQGITENELAFEIEFFIKKNGADLAFPSIVAFGKNSAIPHHVTGNQKLVTNTWVLLDFGAKVDNFCADMTRTVFFGKPNTEQKRMYQAVLDAQRKAFDFIDIGTKAKEADKVARTHITSLKYQTIPHSLGHGIGLEVHEHPRLSPKSKDTLKENMVFSIEPGIYLPDIGGVRIEDLVVLEKSGPRLLSNANRSLIEI